MFLFDLCLVAFAANYVNADGGGVSYRVAAAAIFPVLKEETYVSDNLRNTRGSLKMEARQIPRCSIYLIASTSAEPAGTPKMHLRGLEPRCRKLTSQNNSYKIVTKFKRYSINEVIHCRICRANVGQTATAARRSDGHHPPMAHPSPILKSPGLPG